MAETEITRGTYHYRLRDAVIERRDEETGKLVKLKRVTIDWTGPHHRQGTIGGYVLPEDALRLIEEHAAHG